MKARLDAQIDDLYKVPLEEFTRARNALAKTLTDKEKKAVAALVKPSLPMWIINQLYWEAPPSYNALVDASEKLRSAHRAALAKGNVDTRTPDELHKATVEKAFAQALALARERGVSVSDAARDAIRRTLSALPTDEPAGRLTREPPPVGFSLLTGIKPRPAEQIRKPTAAETQPSPQELKRQKLAEKQAARIRKAAERRARQEEAKARKEREKREREIARAEQALREAERRLAELKK
jgi:hypothetical protein